jgi:peptidoglycan hydrolase-like protein with peptidoglycan-binding domain
MKRLPLLLVTALLLASATANDQLRDVQGALKGQGFYYGEVTGTETPETGAAIRRFQIRNGITVTGKLNPETLAALGLGEKKTAPIEPQPAPLPAPQPSAQPAPAPVADAPVQRQLNPPPPRQAVPKPGDPVPPLKGNNALPPDNEPPDATPQPPRRAKPNDIAVVEPPVAVPEPVVTSFSIIFHGTPYATAPRDVQAGVIRRAQSVMAARNLYRGPLDGIASPATSEALFLFQEQAELRRTGRLDFDTLAEMRLLPPPARGNPLLKPFYNPNRRRDSSVLSN